MTLEQPESRLVQSQNMERTVDIKYFLKKPDSFKQLIKTMVITMLGLSLLIFGIGGMSFKKLIETQRRYDETVYSITQQISGMNKADPAHPVLSEVLPVVQEIQSNLDSTTRTTCLLLAGLIILYLLSSILFFRQISSTVLTIAAHMEEQISESIHSIQDASKHIESASRQVAASAMAHSTSIEESAASMEEMTAMVSQSNLSASNSLNVARDSYTYVEKGKTIISQMKVSMQQIQTANSKHTEILQIISDIQNKTKIINDIVLETRLLSFNASIEAARAGIHGKGFAVVAEEVGNLALISGKAADEIRTLLDSSVTQVNQIIGTTLEKVSAAQVVSEQCEGAFYSMAEAMKLIADAMDGITTAGKQQEQGIRETNRTMMDIAQVSQKNSASAEEMLGQSTALTNLVESISGLVINLRKFIYGNKSEEVIAMKQVQVTPKRPTHSETHPQMETKSITRSDSRWKDVA